MTNRKPAQPNPSAGELARHKLPVLALTAFSAALLLIPNSLPADIDMQAPQKEMYSPDLFASPLPEKPAPRETEHHPVPSPAKPLRIVAGEVAKDQTFSKILEDAGAQGAAVNEIVRTVRPMFNLNRIKQGTPYKVALAEDHSVVFFDYQGNDDQYLRVERRNNGFIPELRTIEYRIEKDLIRGTIRNNLISAVQQGGGNFQVAMELAEIFSWHIDFFKDLRKGDEFRLVLEKKYIGNRFAKFGNILAAVFVNKGKAFDAVYFEDSAGRGNYYNTEGEPLRKQFLKSPLRFSRISSKFGYRRFHPIYKTYLPHLGVDYAAPLGTPVRAVSDGVVAAAGKNSRAGNYIALQHGGIYRTTYSHLSTLSKEVTKGAFVRQGQVIGYVGATGAATGPHLCFHLKRYGKPVNPLTFKSPGSPPLAVDLREAFFRGSLVDRLRLENAAG